MSVESQFDVERQFKPVHTENQFDLVDHPKHYNREGAMECIDEMELVFGKAALADFCLLSCFKYRYRAGLKDDGYQDLEKSDWYMKKYKELKEKIDNNNNSWTIKSPTTKRYCCEQQ